jgi:photosystem II stability/assembly factor-like uncharacterized protein
MADWDGLRRDLEGMVAPPPLAALRERRHRRQQRRAIATTFAVVMVGSAGGVAVLGRGAQQHGGTPVAAPTALSQIVNSDRLPPPRDYQEHVVTDVDFVTPTTGLAIGVRCVGDSCDVATWRTADGGATWSAPVEVATRVPRVSFQAEDPAGGAARSLRMLDESTGFAFNPDLYVTRDGGRTWTRVPQPSKVASISVTGTSVWLAERGCEAGVDCNLVLRSGTAGGTFRDLAVPPTRGAAALVRRAGPDDAYVIAWDAAAAPYASFSRTHDGGRTWTAGTNPCRDATAESLSAGAGRPLWVLCETPAGRRAFSSADHGTTWRRLADPPAEGVVTDLVARSATDAYLTLQTPARLLVTRDGGATWQQAEGTGKGYGYGNLDVVDATHAWAMGDAGLLWRTTDGTRWERLTLPPRAPLATGPPPKPVPSAPADKGVTFTGLSFTDAEHGWALGHRCVGQTCTLVLRRTADGGTTWQVAHAPAQTFVDEPIVPGKVTQVTFANDHDGYLYLPDLYVTHDAGAHWRSVPASYATDVQVRDGWAWVLDYDTCMQMPCGAYVRRGRLGSATLTVGDGFGDDQNSPIDGFATLAVADADNAFLVRATDDGGSKTLLLATDDGGKHWTRRTSPCWDAQVRVASATPGDLWVMCGDEGGVGNQPHRTTHSPDGGRTWHEQESTDGFGYLSVLVALSPTTGWRSDGHATGSIKWTADGGRTWRTARLPRDVGGDVTFSAVDATHAFALFEDDAFVRTTDGTTWERMTRP